MKSHWNRRQFIKATGSGVAVSTAPFVMSDTMAKSSANDRARHAVIGTGGRGQAHARQFSELHDCQVVAVCDVDPDRREKAAKEVSGGERVRKYEDYRRLLEREEIDSISIATCDHWHTPIALAALMSGRHVYVEKPCSHNVHESNLLVKAANEYGKCVQHGTQSRSDGAIREGVRQLQAGAIGKVRAAKAINHQMRGPIGVAAAEEPPPGVNYDLWLGPAPKREFTRNRWHYNWHWFWDYGTGDMGNDGIHHVDVALWGLGGGYPKNILASGAQLFYRDDHETPDTQNVIFEYDDAHLIYEMRLWTPYELEGKRNGNVFYGDDGRLEIDGDVRIVLADGETRTIEGGYRDSHIGNFITAVKGNHPSHLTAPIEVGAISANLCHLGNIGTRLGGRKLAYDAEREMILGDPEAHQMLSREYRTGYELPYHG